MKAIAITPGTPGARITNRPEPAPPTPNDVTLRVLNVGICGTDRAEVSGGRARAPDGHADLVIGHEMLGQVTAIGASAAHVHVDDLAVFSVRRGCGACLACRINRADMCQTGLYRERGIWGLDGYQTEYVVDTMSYLVTVPPELSAIGVLLEPLSIVEKAINEALRLQIVRRPDAATTPDWLFGQRCLVAGLGPVGLLAAMVLSLRGARVYGLDVVDADSARPRWLAGVGGEYIDGRRVPADRVSATIGSMELIVEAAGIAVLEFRLLDALALNGAYVITGIPGGDRPLEVSGAELIRRMVLDNQLMLGSVNAAPGHFQMAVHDLQQAHRRWGAHVAALITRYAVPEAPARLREPSPAAIKEVVSWSMPRGPVQH